jgi:hypothetical protein
MRYAQGVRDVRRSDITRANLTGLFQPRGIAYIGVPRRGRLLGGLAVAFGAARPGSAALHVVHLRCTHGETLEKPEEKYKRAPGRSDMFNLWRC